MSATLPPPGDDSGPGFTDARGCKEWLGRLPLTNLSHAQSLLLEALRRLEESEIAALERLKCLELLRDKVAFLQAGQRARYFGKTLPLSASDADAWKSNRGLLERMESGYRKALQAAGAGAGEAAAHVPLIAQRIVRYAGAQMLMHAGAYRRFDPQLWERMHRQYAAAERGGYAEERVRDSLESGDGTSSVAEAYVHAVMEQAACLAELTAAQIDMVGALLRLWARRVAVREKPEQPGAQLALTVDFDKPIGARPRSAAELGPSLRVLDVEQVSRSLRKRIHALQQGAEFSTLGLPAEVAEADALEQLRRLHRLWCEGAPPRPPSRVPDEKSAGLAFGVGEIYFFVSGGKAFEQPDRKRELTRQEKQDIEVFGRVTERTQSMMVSEHNYSVDTWSVIDEMIGAWRVERPASSTRGVSIGRLVAMRLGPTAPFFLGRLSALSQETDGRLIATVTLFPGRPETLAARAADSRNRATAQWTQGFRLPALDKLKVPESLVVASGIASRGRGIQVWEGEAAKERTVYEVLERGTDFDRITVF